jgi:putative transposase
MEILFHVLNRGVDKRNIFIDEQDYFRFIHDLFEFNDENPVNSTFYIFKESNDVSKRNDIIRKKRKLLVNIFTFCLMPNHYHLLLQPRTENSISKFIHKLNMGYSQYFNKKYERKGTLFEGKYKSISVKNESHFIHLPYYIHLNPLDLVVPEWRNGELKNYREAIKFLENYRWSSFLDYIGKKNFPSVIQKNFLSQFWEGENEYKKSIFKWLKDLELDNLEGTILE